ncbi:AtpZ/AtpI family protein [Murinocardiopsis flavida]|nr:hypothetical protein [Murinocardiopsis flavida]
MNDQTSDGPDQGRRPDGMAIVSYLLAGLALWGGIGWLADWAFGYETLFLPIGLLIGMVGSLYLIITQFVRS